MHSQPLTKSLRERTSSVNVVQLKPRRRFLHRMGLLQVLNDYVQVAIVKLRTPARHFGQAPDKVDGLIFLRELAQTIDELRMEQSGHDDSMQACAREFGIHHETRDPPIAVDERMNFRHQKHVENSTSYSLRNAESDARTFFEGSPYLRRVHELGRTGVVRLRLNISRAGFRPRMQHFCVPLQQRGQKLFSRYRRVVPVRRFDRQLIYTENVVRVLWPRRHDLVVNDNVARFLNREFRAFHVVRKIRLDECPIVPRDASRNRVFDAGQSSPTQVGGEQVEALHTLPVDRFAFRHKNSVSRLQFTLLVRPEECANHAAQGYKLFLHAKWFRQRRSLVTQFVEKPLS